MPGIEFKDVARLLTCRSFAEAEGMKLRGGRAVCPFHSGADGFNLAFMADGHCHCHRCGRTADVVQLAAAVWRLPQREAAAELNQRFHLGLEAEAVNAAELERRRRDRERERAAQVRRRRAEAVEWSAACDAERDARRALERFTEAEADTPAFNAALKRLADAQMRCELLQAERVGG